MVRLFPRAAAPPASPLPRSTTPLAVPYGNPIEAATSPAEATTGGSPGKLLPSLYIEIAQMIGRTLMKTNN
ncbi:unnamed protein product [Miscanthus lutarioriparius]|uniref:Uncharacterized protein n=1 Tax=Miscanthus lutarioriparius TaxID=422564 RepID=A0A811NL10_9POAL|nr:unnamed protein product [Miscanthus lutarioriparius]